MSILRRITHSTIVPIALVLSIGFTAHADEHGRKMVFGASRG